MTEKEQADVVLSRKAVFVRCCLNIPSDTKGIEFGFIGGAPLLEFDLIKEIVDYVRS